MMLDDEDVFGQEPETAQSADGPSLEDQFSQQLMQLLMRSQDLGDGDTGTERGSDGGNASSTPDDAPVVADAEIDIMPRAEPPSPVGSLPRAILQFCRDHGVDPAALPVAGPSPEDPGATFDAVLSGSVTPIGVTELQMVSATTKVDPAQGHHVLGVRHLALCGRTKGPPEPASFSDLRVLRLRIDDVKGDTLSIVIVDEAAAAAPPADFLTAAIRRFPAGTAVAIEGFDMIVESDGFIVVARQDDPDCRIRRLGASELPPVKLSQVERQCSLLHQMDRLGAMVRVSVEGVRDAEAEVAATLHPLLTRLAVAHLRLGADGVALAYAVAALMLVFQKGPATAATVAAQVLNKMGLKNGACSALYLGDFPNGHALEPAETVAHAGLKAMAGVDGSRSIGTDERVSAAVKAGMTQIAEGLAQTEAEWLNHGLGPADAVRMLADRAVAVAGADAAGKLLREGDDLFTEGTGSAGGAAIRKRHKVEEATRRWRAALWRVLDPEGSPGKAGYSAWSIVNTRYKFWHEAAGQIQPPALHYMDLAALAMMRGELVNASALRSNVYKGRCKIDDWQAVLDDVLAASIVRLDIKA